MARRRNSNRRRRRGSFGFLYKMLSVLVICVAIIAALTLFFRVDAIQVSGQQRYTDEQVQAASGIQIGDNLFLLNKYDAAGRIVEELPYIEDTRINRNLPSTLVIEGVINEAVDLAKYFSNPESGAFVNGILDRHARKRKSC